MESLNLKNIKTRELPLLVQELAKTESNNEVVLEDLHLIDDLLSLMKLKDMFNTKMFASNSKSKKQKFADVAGDLVLNSINNVKQIKNQ